MGVYIDSSFVMGSWVGASVWNAAGEFIELQGTGEESTFSEVELTSMLALGKAGIGVGVGPVDKLGKSFSLRVVP